MSFTRVLDITAPADADTVGAGAGEIRNYKVDVRERMEIDHNFDQSGVVSTAKNSDGTHKKITMATMATPAAIADAGVLYVRNSLESKPELFFIDEDGNDRQITGQASGSDATERTYATAAWATEDNLTVPMNAIAGDIIEALLVMEAKSGGATNYGQYALADSNGLADAYNITNQNDDISDGAVGGLLIKWDYGYAKVAHRCFFRVATTGLLSIRLYWTALVGTIYVKNRFLYLRKAF